MNTEKRKKIFDFIAKTVNSFIGAEVTSEDDELHKLGLDSLDRVELIMECEKEYQISLPDYLTERKLTVGQLIDEILQLM